MKDVENVVKNSRKLGKLPEKPRKDRGQYVTSPFMENQWLTGATGLVFGRVGPREFRFGQAVLHVALLE